MALFGGNKEDKKAKKAQAIMDKYGLGDLSKDYLDAVKNINLELAGTGAMEFGINLTGKAEDITKISYLNTLIAQNWIIIRQLDEINKKIK